MFIIHYNKFVIRVYIHINADLLNAIDYKSSFMTYKLESSNSNIAMKQLLRNNK